MMVLLMTVRETWCKIAPREYVNDKDFQDQAPQMLKATIHKFSTRGRHFLNFGLRWNGVGKRCRFAG